MEIMKQASCPNRTGGFSLIAVSILLTVAALVFASMLPGIEAGDTNQKTLNNGRKLERIEEAMRSFMATNGRRPCPADGQYAENTAYFGIEAGTPGICTGNTAPTPNAPLGPDAGTGYVVGGVIPTKTLGLPDEYAYDDYGRRFTYVVDIRATESVSAAITNNDAIITAGGTNTHAPGCYNLQQNIKLNGAVPGITIENTSGGAVIDHTMYVYISHGASGYGAWPAQGAATPATRINSGSTDSDMQVNAGVNSSFTYSTANFTNVKIQKDRVISSLPSGGTDTGFDDFVWYRPDTKNTCCLGAACLQTGFAARGNRSETAVVGDVNGDGIPDLIIGGGHNDGSAVYVVFGTRSGFPDPLPLASLNGTNGFTLNGVIATNYAGYSLAVGDINGDGISDIIIGDTSTVSLIYYGYTYVVFGKRGAWPASQLLNVGYGNLIDGTQGVRFDAPTSGDYSGYSAAAGDINGDGYADIVIGAPNANSSAGYTYVKFGASANGSPFLANTTVTTTSGSTVITPGSYAGLMVGENLTSVNIPAGTTIASCNAANTKTVGTVCTSNIKLSALATASASGTAMSVASAPLATGSGTFIDGSQGVRFDGVSVNDSSGWALATGDFNADGYADVIIGAYYANSRAGYTYVKFGKSTTSGAFLASTTYTYSSTSITPASYADLMVGETVAGTSIPTGTTIASCNSGLTAVGTVCTSSVVLSASPTGSGTLYVATTPLAIGTGTFIDGTQGVRFDGVANDYSGWSVASGDVNGDGIADIVIGAYGANIDTGRAYVVFGQSAGWSLPNFSLALPASGGTLINGTQGVRFDGETSSDDAGYSVAAGDINGDGYADIVIGAYFASYSAMHSGSTYVIFGKNTGWGTAGNVVLNTGSGNLIDGVQGFRLDGAAKNTASGVSVGSGDVNGDGISDMTIGSPGGGATAGSVYTYFGHKTSPQNPWPNPNTSLGGL
jgi:hypothetical protein